MFCKKKVFDKKLEAVTGNYSKLKSIDKTYL